MRFARSDLKGALQKFHKEHVRRKKLKQISREVFDLSKADQTEVIVGGGESTTMRFANNHIHQPTSQLGSWIKVRLVVGKKIGVAAGNQLDKKSLVSLVERATEICHYQKDDPGFKSLPASTGSLLAEARERKYSVSFWMACGWSPVGLKSALSLNFIAHHILPDSLCP